MTIMPPSEAGIDTIDLTVMTAIHYKRKGVSNERRKKTKREKEVNYSFWNPCA
jgi:hypothetical protein